VFMANSFLNLTIELGRSQLENLHLR